MPQPLSSSLSWELAKNLWSQIINPVISNPLNNILVLNKIFLVNGETTINHKLGRMMQGWFIVDVDGPATIHRSEPLNNFTLTLTSDADVTCNIGVF